MSHQLIGKKWRFEIPPLNWKAPEATLDSEADAAPAEAEASKDGDKPRLTA
ncbi:hypothetical protein [Achromobacter sp. UMC46]|uniref:hypothetical protein n=1 Tax=Achromobacter sp. UMC46 TaxID=1862319 RepID=UPI0016006497|nr:hypothetical protein [Achromobacter sp. UMC46]